MTSYRLESFRNKPRHLSEGDLVKLIFMPTEEDPSDALPERMWVLITKQLENGTFIGTLDNDPSRLTQIKAGDTVAFESEHIYDTYDHTSK